MNVYRTIGPLVGAFYSTSRCLDDVLNIDNPYFEGKVNQNYPHELQLNKANTSDNEAPFWIYIYLFLTVLSPQKCMINAITLNLILQTFHFLMAMFHEVPLKEYIFLNIITYKIC